MKFISFFKTKKGILSLISFSLFIWFLFCLPHPLFKTPTSTVLEDSEGHLLSARIAEDGQWRFPAVDTLPAKYVQALLAYEDKRYFNQKFEDFFNSHNQD